MIFKLWWNNLMNQHQFFLLLFSILLSSSLLVMGPSPGSARARPGPVCFFRDRARNFEKGPGSTQARDRFFEKGLEIWDFYVVKNGGSSRLEIELLWRAWARARLEIDFQGSGSARDRFFRAQPITRPDQSWPNSKLPQPNVIKKASLKSNQNITIRSSIRIRIKLG